LWPEVFELAESRRVKSFNRYPWDSQLTQTCAQFACGSAGIRERKNSICSKLPFGYSVGNAMGYGSGLSSAGPCQNASWANQSHGCLPLFRIKRFE
jgi:hypothetical protein